VAMRDLHYYTVQSVILNFDRHLILNLFERFVKVTSRRGTVEAKATIIQKRAPGSIFIMTPAKSKRSAARSAGGIILGAKRRRITDASVNLLTNPAFSETR